MPATSLDVNVAQAPRLLTALRNATQSVHARLERRLPLAAPSLTLDAYRIIVESFHGYHLPLERLLDNVAPSVAGLHWEERRRRSLLRLDVIALGGEASVDALATCARLPSLDSPSAALGCLYVVEGATLGGRVVSRLLRARLGLDATNGAAFFAGYGERTSLMWRGFLECLAAAEAYVDEDRVTESALETFVTLEAWLEERQVLS